MQKNKEQRREEARASREKRKLNPIAQERYKEWCRNFHRKERAKRSDIFFKKAMRTCIGMSLKRWSAGPKSKRTIELIGCTVKHLRTHLESLFLPGMTWQNYGKYGWHVDHKIPCASFDLSIPENQSKCFHFTNLQPLWWMDNISKGAKIL